MGTAELEEERWVASGVGILKLSILLYSHTAIFHVQVQVNVEISFSLSVNGAENLNSECTYFIFLLT